MKTYLKQNDNGQRYSSKTLCLSSLFLAVCMLTFSCTSKKSEKVSDLTYDPSRGEFVICNMENFKLYFAGEANTGNRATSKGWFTVESRSCQKISGWISLGGQLVSRPSSYYIQTQYGRYTPAGSVYNENESFCTPKNRSLKNNWSPLEYNFNEACPSDSKLVPSIVLTYDGSNLSDTFVQFKATLVGGTIDSSDKIDVLIASERQELNKLQSEMHSLSERSYRNLVYEKNDLEQERKLLESVKNRSLDELTNAELAGYYKARQLIEAARLKVSEKKSLLEQQLLAIENRLKQIRDVIYKELSDAGIDIASENIYSDSIVLEMPSISLPAVENDPAFNEPTSIYKILADNTLEKLELALKEDNRNLFIEIVYNWNKNNESLLQTLRGRLELFPKEHESYLKEHKRIDDYVFGTAEGAKGYLDRSLWFKDSPVPASTRQAITESIKEKNEFAGLIFENELKTWKGRLSQKQLSAVLVIEALGHAYRSVPRDAGEALGQLHRIASGVAAIFTETASCIAKVGAVGDAGDFYEAVSGFDLCSGERLTIAGQALSVAGLIVFNGKTWHILGEVIGIQSVVKNAAESVVKYSKNVGVADSELQKVLASRGKTPKFSDKNFKSPDIFTDRHGKLTNGKYTISVEAMQPHTVGSFDSSIHTGYDLPANKSQFFLRTDAERLTLDAAAYADELGLWVGNKAKVTLDIPIGVHGGSGKITSTINVYRKASGTVHGSPASQ